MNFKLLGTATVVRERDPYPSSTVPLVANVIAFPFINSQSCSSQICVCVYYVCTLVLETAQH